MSKSTYSPAAAEGIDAATRLDLLAIADTKLVLGNWYGECVINGRSLPDFAAMLGMSAANYGHTRALYQLLAAHGDDFAHLERGRDAAGIHSMELLDQAPQCWEDFMATIWLAELATWTLASRYLQHPNRTLAGIVRRIGQEGYFHLKYAEGWIQVFAKDAAVTERFMRHLMPRLERAARWFVPAQGEADLRSAFLAEVAKGVQPLQGEIERPAANLRADWRGEARRHGPLPAGLFEVVRFKNPELAH